MSAQPAEDEYQYDVPPRTGVFTRRPAEVISLPNRRAQGRHSTDTDQERARAQAPDQGSAARLSLSDLPGDWASITTVWHDSPESLSELVARIGDARASSTRTAAGIGLACWAVLVLIPRGLFHLASWILSHPLRLMAAAVLAAIFLATL